MKREETRNVEDTRKEVSEYNRSYYLEHKAEIAKRRKLFYHSHLALSRKLSRESQRRRGGYKPRKKGGRGRPPLPLHP